MKLLCGFVEGDSTTNGWELFMGDNGFIMYLKRLSDPKHKVKPKFGSMKNWVSDSNLDSTGKIGNNCLLFIYHFEKAIVKRGIKALKYPSAHKDRLNNDPRIGLVFWNRVGAGETIIFPNGMDLILTWHYAEINKPVFHRDRILTVLNSFGIPTAIEDQLPYPSEKYAMGNVLKGNISINGGRWIWSGFQRSHTHYPSIDKFGTYDFSGIMYDYDDNLYQTVYQPPEWTEPSSEYFQPIETCSPMIRYIPYWGNNKFDAYYEELKISDPEEYLKKRSALPKDEIKNLPRWTGIRNEFPLHNIDKKTFRERLVLEFKKYYQCAEIEIKQNDMGLFE